MVAQKRGMVGVSPKAQEATAFNGVWKGKGRPGSDCQESVLQRKQNFQHLPTILIFGLICGTAGLTTHSKEDCSPLLGL